MVFPIQRYLAEVEKLCRRYAVTRLELFGSGARPDFNGTSSDLDFLVEFDDFHGLGSSERFFGLLHGLEDVFKRHIDLVERTSVENSTFLKVAERDRRIIYDASTFSSQAS